MKTALRTVVFLLVIISCKKKEQPAVPTELSEKILLNQSYGIDARNLMDIYLPKGRTTATKLLLLIHGGAWVTGDKTDLNSYIDSIRKRMPNLAIANMSYRLAFNPINTFPAANNDVNAAINYLLSKQAEFVISDKLAIMGVSAGGHLALYEAYKNNAAGKIKATVSVFGPTDMQDMWQNPAGTAAITQLGLTNYLGATYPANNALYQQASPITYVNANSVPTQIFHGTADTLVRYQQSIALRNKLQTFSRPVQYIEYAGAGHGWVGATLTDTFDKLAAFLQQYLQ
jgi:acetyl esterase/lipase